MIEILAVLLVALLIIAFIINKKIEIEREIAENKYLLDLKKLRNASKTKKKDSEEYEDDVQDFVDSLPKWLSSIAEGANIDLEAVYEGNPEELAKVKTILEKNLPQGQGQQNDSGGLIG